MTDMQETIDRGPAFGPSGESVYRRTYSRVKPDGSNETWWDTVNRVVDGNLGLVDSKYIEPDERQKLVDMMYDFKILPAGRHLWASGVPGSQYLTNCFVSHWTERPSEHFEFSFMRAMEGGGVGTNFSAKYLPKAVIKNALEVHIVCDEWNPDYAKMVERGLISTEYGQQWHGAYAVEDSREGWAAAIVDLVDTFFRDDVKHQKRVYDVTKVRPEGAPLKSFGGSASGPAPLAVALKDMARVLSDHIGEPLTPLMAMELDHILAQCVLAGGVRRTARMSIVDWDDPDVMDFIRCKSDSQSHWTTNISVGVDEDFFDALNYRPGADYTTAKADKHNEAREVLDAVAAGMLANGEPGFVNFALARKTDPDVVAVNPCGEQFLAPWDACNLGHINLAAFADAEKVFDWRYDPVDVDDDPYRVIFDDLLEAHRLMARFLVRATFGDKADEKQKEAVERNRRIGVGHLGFASFLALSGIRYSDSASDDNVRDLLQELYAQVRKAADEYAYELRIPSSLKVTTIAPTGTIAKMPGVTEGLHPPMYKHFIRRIRFSTVRPDEVRQLEDYAARGFKIEDDLYAANTKVVEIPTEESLISQVTERGIDDPDWLVQCSTDLTARDMLAVQAMYQEHYSDSGVSCTVNVQPESISTDELADLLAEYLPVLKGCTIFPAVSRPQSPYEEISREEYELAKAVEVSDSVDEDCASGACPVR